MKIDPRNAQADSDILADNDEDESAALPAQENLDVIEDAQIDHEDDAKAVIDTNEAAVDEDDDNEDDDNEDDEDEEDDDEDDEDEAIDFQGQKSDENDRDSEIEPRIGDKP